MSKNIRLARQRGNCVYLCVREREGENKSNWDKGTWVILSLCLGLKNSSWTSTGTCRTGFHHLQLTPWKPESINSLTSPLTSPPWKNTHACTPANCLLLSAHWFSLSVLSAHWLIVPQSVQLMALFLFSSCPDIKMPRPCVFCWTTGGIYERVWYYVYVFECESLIPHAHGHPSQSNGYWNWFSWHFW